MRGTKLFKTTRSIAAKLVATMLAATIWGCGGGGGGSGTAAIPSQQGNGPATPAAVSISCVVDNENFLYAVVCGKDTFVAVGDGGAVKATQDLKTWNDRNAGVSTALL